MSARPLFFVTILVLALAAMAALNIATPAGAGLANDSAAYIAGARSILQGKGYSDIWLDSELEAITHYPPLLSLTLAAIGLLKIDPLRGARILNIFLFGANTALMGVLGWRATRSQIAGVWLAAIFLLNASLLRVHVFALSEPLFLFLSLSGFLFIDLSLVSGLTQGRKMAWVALAGLTCGLAFLSRYSALALLPTFAITLILMDKSGETSVRVGWFARIKTTVVFFAAAIPVMAAWFARNELSAGNATNRSFHYHPITAENIQPGFYNFAQFLAPFESWQKTLLSSGVLYVALGALALGLLIWLVQRVWLLGAALFPGKVKNGKIPASGSIGLANTLYFFGYLAAILFSMSFFDASTKFQPRILAPLYVALMLLSAIGGVWLWRRKNRGLQGLAVGLAVIAIAFSAYGWQQSLSLLTQAGQGYASWKWHDSELMASLRALPPQTAIYTNTPPAVYLVTGRASRTLPTAIDPVDEMPRSHYMQDLAQMRADLLAGRAVLALFDTTSLEDTLKIPDGAVFIDGLVILQKTQGDVLYGKP